MTRRYHIIIEKSDAISNTTYHRRCTSEGQRYWWLRGDEGFVDIPQHRADKAWGNLVVELDPGTYTLGAGPRGRHGVRYAFEIAPDGAPSVDWVERVEGDEEVEG